VPLIRNFRYRPEIDGLRGIAVLAVLLYHARLGVSGGFVGVDVFFVISGYLITSLIVTDIQEGKFSIMHFWERRARRIVPAIAVVVIATLLAGWFLLLPDDYRQLGKSASFQSVFAANIYFWKNTHYFAGPAEQMPLLHTWSLSVEEQFYLIVPFALSVLCQVRKNRHHRRIVVGLILAGIVISFAASAYGVFQHPVASFYALPTRAWELMLGSLVAFLVPDTLGPGKRAICCWLALCFILVPCFAYSKETPFPGLAALSPCLGAALFIWATGGRLGERLPQVGRLLASRPLVFVGLISYSLYLWHWPLFAFTSYWALEPITMLHRVALALISLLLAALSWRFVESPFRKKLLLPARPRMLLFATAVLAIVFAASILIVYSDGFPSRLPDRVQALASAKHSMKSWGELTVEDVEAGRLHVIGNDNVTVPITAIVWGDSHALAVLPAFDAFLKEVGRNGRAADHASTAPVLGYWRLSKWWKGKQALPFNWAVLNYIKRSSPPPTDVFLIAHWGEYPLLSDDGKTEITSALLETVRELRKAGTQPWVILQIPDQPVNPIHTLARSCLTHRDYRHLLARPSEFNGIHGSNPDLIDRLRSAGAKIIDPRPAFYDLQLGAYRIEKDGVVLYCDNDHLTTEGALELILPLIRRELNFSSGDAVQDDPATHSSSITGSD